VLLLSRKYGNSLSPLATMTNFFRTLPLGLIIVFSVAFFAPSSYADVACWRGCSQDAERGIFADGTVCGAGAANGFDNESEPMCLGYEKPACDDNMPWMCDEDGCSNLDTYGFGTYWTGSSCIITDGRFWYEGSDFEGTFGSTDETWFWDDTSANFSRISALLEQILAVLKFFLPLAVIFLFVDVFVSMLRFIRSFFYSKDDTL